VKRTLELDRDKAAAIAAEGIERLIRERPELAQLLRRKMPARSDATWPITATLIEGERVVLTCRGLVLASVPRADVEIGRRSVQ
jgi:hypothetical protein